MVNTTYNPSDKLNVNLTGGNLIATGAGSYGGVRSTDKQITGKFYFEHTFTTRTNFQTNAGICTAITALNKEQGGQSYTGQASVYGGGGNVYVGSSNSIIVGGVSSSVTFGALASGTIIGVAVDLSAQLIWFRIAPAGNWNNNATYDPVAGVGGISIAGQTSNGQNPIYAMASFQVSPDVITSNFGNTAFSGVVPSGYTAGFPAGAVVPLNAILTQIALEEWGIGSPQGWLTQIAVEQWASVGAVSGKFYFEITATTIVGPGGASDSIGVAVTASTYTGIGVNATIGVVMFTSNGAILSNGATTGLNIGACASGDIIGFAIDLDNRKAWFRKSPSGNWNGQAIANQNPVTNTGGAVIPPGSITPICTFGGTGGTTGNVFTANFGASAYSGAVPVGFASGWAP